MQKNRTLSIPEPIPPDEQTALLAQLAELVAKVDHIVGRRAIEASRSNEGTDVSCRNPQFHAGKAAAFRQQNINGGGKSCICYCRALQKAIRRSW